MSSKIPMARRRNTGIVAEAETIFPGGRISAMARESASAIDVRQGRRELSELGLMLPCNLPVLEARRANFFANRYDRSNASHMEEFKQLTMDAASDPRRWNELAAYRVFEMTGDVMAIPFALSAFQTMNLSADELPMIVKPRSKNLNSFTAWEYSVNGGAGRSAQWRTDFEKNMYEMEAFQTDKVTYPLMDLQIGNITEQDAVAERLAYDKEMKIDETALAAIDSIETASGLKEHLDFHPSVNQDSVPDGNYLDLTGGSYGAAGRFTMLKLKAILRHIRLFGATVAEQKMAISAIHCSPLVIDHCWDFIDLVSGWDTSAGIKNHDPAQTVTTAQREQIYNTGFMTQAWGNTWTWNPNSQVDTNRIYIFTNQPVGWMFTKSEFDQMIKWDATNSPTHAEWNMGEQLMRWTMKFVIPDLWKYRVVMVDI